MTNELPTIDIKGKSYVLVKDRILAFNELYPNGSITTELVSPVESKIVVVKATVTPDVKNPARCFSDYSQAVIGQGMVNTTAAMENASTSACGRALAYMGIGVIESIASADEMNKATHKPQEVDPTDNWNGPVRADDEPYCAEHKIKYFRYEKNGKVWYSHKNADDTWCNMK